MSFSLTRLGYALSCYGLINLEKSPTEAFLELELVLENMLFILSKLICICLYILIPLIAIK